MQIGAKVNDISKINVGVTLDTAQIQEQLNKVNAVLKVELNTDQVLKSIEELNKKLSDGVAVEKPLDMLDSLLAKTSDWLELFEGMGEKEKGNTNLDCQKVHKNCLFFMIGLA